MHNLHFNSYMHHTLHTSSCKSSKLMISMAYKGKFSLQSSQISASSHPLKYLACYTAFSCSLFISSTEYSWKTHISRITGSNGYGMGSLPAGLPLRFLLISLVRSLETSLASSRMLGNTIFPADCSQAWNPGVTVKFLTHHVFDRLTKTNEYK